MERDECQHWSGGGVSLESKLGQKLTITEEVGKGLDLTLRGYNQRGSSC